MSIRPEVRTNFRSNRPVVIAMLAIVTASVAALGAPTSQSSAWHFVRQLQAAETRHEAPAGLNSREAPGSSLDAAGAEFDRLRQEGNTAVYSLDYDAARTMFSRMTTIAPANPAGYVYLANNLWLETLNKGRRLSTSLYSSSSFYVQKSESDKLDKQRDRQFNEWIGKAIEASTALLKKNPTDVEALYYEASAYGLRAGYTGTVGRSFRRAIGDANKSIQLQTQVLKLDPKYYDAYLSVGLYEYVVDSLPFVWRVLARLAGLRGSKERGIAELETAVKKGKYVSDDARVVLIGIYSREHEPARALELIDLLAAKYPRNFLFSVERARMLWAMGRKQEGEQAYADLLKDPRTAAVATDLVNYQWGESLREAGDSAGAIPHYDRVVQWAKADPGLVSLSHLHAGQSFDSLGKRKEAISQYQIVLARENVFDSHDKAREYLDAPYAQGQRDRQ
ncbi:MAG TPA: hypothetical protein VJX67_11475 [Blastocatellia bacterium]|nr:hypothetical protein [Blastocatellia bacterium]